VDEDVTHHCRRVMKVMSRTSGPQSGQRSGNSSQMRSSSNVLPLIRSPLAVAARPRPLTAKLSRPSERQLLARSATFKSERERFDGRRSQFDPIRSPGLLGTRYFVGAKADAATLPISCAPAESTSPRSAQCSVSLEDLPYRRCPFDLGGLAKGEDADVGRFASNRRIA
jgi:hypothetical protein